MRNIYNAIKIFINEWKKYDNANYIKLQNLHLINSNENNVLGKLLCELFIKHIKIIKIVFTTNPQSVILISLNLFLVYNKL